MENKAIIRLAAIDKHMKEHLKVVKKSRKELKPTLNVWDHMGLDMHLTPKGVEIKRAIDKVMTESKDELNQYYAKSKFPFFMLERISTTGVNGLMVAPEHGGPGLTFVETAAMSYEMARHDASFATGFYVHNLAMYTINYYGSEEQKQRLLPPYAKFEKVASFGLTEPEFGSFANGIQTNAQKVSGGYLLNGEKFWIGNGTIGDCMVWARNEDEMGKIQAFVVDGMSPGLSASRIDEKLALRSVINAHIKLENVYVPECNKIANIVDFEQTTTMLTHSRLIVAWIATGLAAGAYEAALKYALQREQFFRPIAAFQLVQEKLSRMLALVEAMISQCLVLSIAAAKVKDATYMARCSRAKAITGRLGREVVALAREVCGGNGILLQNHVMKAFVDMEAIYTYEGTYDINMLVAGREMTGGLFALK